MQIDALIGVIPWQLKMLAKICLSKLPVKYTHWRKLRLFRHGAMNKGKYALNNFKGHCERILNSSSFSGRALLELGPGDSIATGLIAHAYGTKKTYLVDVGNFAERDYKIYHQMLAEWETEGITSDLKECCSFEDLCAKSGTIYLTEGLQSLRSIPAGSVDIVFSTAVLEHIRRSEFTAIMTELHRILKPDGFGSHQIDLKDHIGGSLNNLRFSERVWESSLFAKAGFYTNRIRFGEMLGFFKQSGFRVKVIRKNSWPSLPTPRDKMWYPFRSLPDSDLLVSDFQIAHDLESQRN